MDIINSNLDIKYDKLDYGNKPERIILHHIEASLATVEDINSWHLDNGWACIGYNYYVRKSGEVFRGRPNRAVGAHCKGQNTCSIGIALEGNFTTETPTEAQKRSTLELIEYLKNKYGINEVKLHRDFNSTECPGTNFNLDLGVVANYATSGYRQEALWLQILCNQLGVRDKDDNNLAEDGIIGDKTRYAITQLPQLSLKSGNVIATRHIQNLLNINSDGIYGKETEAAVVLWQKNNELVPDGIVGPKTWLSFA